MRQTAPTAVATAAATTVGSQTPTALSTAGSTTSNPSANTSMVSRLTQAPAMQQIGAAAVRSPVRGRSPLREQPAAEAASGPPSRGVPVPAWSSELKNSIESLVNKVNRTIKKEGQLPAPVEHTAASQLSSVEASLNTLPAQSPPIAGLGNSVLRFDAMGQAVNQQDGFLQALQAVQELRERNLCLREENAELVEELLNQDGLMTPSQAYLASASQSTCATPSQQQQPTAQLPAGMLRGRSPDTTPLHTAPITQAGRAETSKPMPNQQMTAPGSSTMPAGVAVQQLARVPGSFQTSAGLPQRPSVGGVTPTTTTPGTASATAALRYPRGPAASTGQSLSVTAPGAPRKKYMV